MSAIAGYIGSLISSYVAWLSSCVAVCAQWVFSIFTYCISFAWYAIELLLQQIFLALVVIANTAITLLPACNVPTIDLTSFASTFNTSGNSLASVVCWLVPISFLSTLVLCMIQTIMAYLMISWVLRWLKVIK